MDVNADGGLGGALQRLNSETQVRSVVVVATNGSEPDFWCKGIRGGDEAGLFRLAGKEGWAQFARKD